MRRPSHKLTAMRPQPEATPRTRTGWTGTVLVTVIVMLMAWLTLQPAVSGQFHDDGLYLSTAQSLAEGRGYRHASLPTTPVQTKYPPLYSAVLAGVWKVAPSFPEGIPWFKATSVLFLGAVTLCAGAVGRRRIGGSVAPAAFAFLAAASPLVFPFADYTLTELPFLALCLAAFWLAPYERGEGGQAWRAVTLGAVCGAALLIRLAAVPLVAAGVVCYASRRQWRELAIFALPAGLILAPWLWFRAANPADLSNPLLAYYVAYEPSVPSIALGDPTLAGHIVLANLYYLWTSLDLASYLAYSPPARVLLYPAFALGLWRLLRHPLDFMTAFALLYGGLILLWPWHPSRYAIPLAPFIPLTAFLAGRWLRERLVADAPDGSRGPSTVGALAWAPVAVLTLMAIGWLAAYAPRSEATTRAAFLVRLEYRWDGFEETARWIDDNTEAEAVLATAYDPLYYLHTGRRGVRPWLHRPWTYFYPLSDPRPDVGDAAAIRPALDELGARYLVIDPLDGYEEEDAAIALYEDLLAGYAGPEYGAAPVLRFTSRDGRHRVYELPARISAGGSRPATDPGGR